MTEDLIQANLSTGTDHQQQIQIPFRNSVCINIVLLQAIGRCLEKRLTTTNDYRRPHQEQRNFLPSLTEVRRNSLLQTVANCKSFRRRN